jgi:hypothetical protein
VNNSATTQVATITVTPVLVTTGGSCPGTPVTFTITVFPRPQVNVGADQEICENQKANLTANWAAALRAAPGRVAQALSPMRLLPLQHTPPQRANTALRSP